MEIKELGNLLTILSKEAGIQVAIVHNAMVI